MSTTASSDTAMEDEWEEDEQLVVAELSGMISSDIISSRQGTCKIVDIDSEQPMMQVGRYLFAGEYEDAIGTCVIFEEDGAGSNPALKYKCHTMKKLMLQRTFLSERKEDEPVSNKIEVLALQEEESFGRKSAVCHYLDPIDTEKSVLDESKDCEDPEMSDESADEMDETETEAGATLLENSAEETMNASSCSQLAATQEGDDGS
ncbi:general transcription factor 3C polypeptide 6 [Garra rufa]|uniref:general transcription factor 3C polypeptide 6 n=1 Tax=Garra rufa TaxID=137080 RepID=UPI003CCEBB35